MIIFAIKIIIIFLISPQKRLNYPSDDVIIICLQTEKIMKSFSYQDKPIKTLFLQSQVLQNFYNSDIFNSLKSHSLESTSPLSNHVILLIKSISCTYIKLKNNYNLKLQNENPSLRMWYNNLFRGQYLINILYMYYKLSVIKIKNIKKLFIFIYIYMHLFTIQL